MTGSRTAGSPPARSGRSGPANAWSECGTTSLSMANIKALAAEFIGTFFLCFAGIAAILSNTPVIGGGLGIVGIALAHGLALSVAISVFGGASGAHFNPAVTVGLLST